MQLRRIELFDFRNLEAQELEIPAEGVALIGANAQGKSNLLEAIYYLETLRSFRGARDAHLVRFGCDLFRLRGELRGADEEGTITLSAAYRKSDRSKRVLVDGERVGRLSEGLGKLGAVVFSPVDVDVVSGPPEGRRRFLDMVLSLNEPGYLASLQAYRRTLSQRNAALRAGARASEVRAWNPSLAQSGAVVLARRAAWVDEWGEAFREYYAAVAGGQGASLAYRSTVANDGENTEAAFIEALESSTTWEDRSRTTTVGPHRDDLKIRLGPSEGSIDLRGFGSGGQLRTAALALRLVEAAQVRKSRGHPPLMLMDDVFAELDERRSGRVLELFDAAGWGQVILTGPKKADLAMLPFRLPRWTIHAGRIAA